MLATSYGEKWLWSTLTRTDNWIVKSNPLGSDAAAADINFTSDPFVAGTLYFMGNNNKNAPVLVTSNDRGSTWNSDRAVTLPLDGPLSGPTLYFDHTRGERMYLVDSGRMITSGDHGNNWSRCADTPATGTSQTLLAVDPRDSRHIYLATQGKGVLASADACQSWSTGAEGLSYPNVNTLALDPANPNLVYAGTDNGVFASNNGGKSWSSANDGLLNNPPVYSFALDTRNSVVYAATPYGIFKLGLK